MNPLEHPLHDPLPGSTSLAGMLAAVSFRLDRSGDAWTLDLVGLEPAVAVELVEATCRSLESSSNPDSVATTRPITGDVVSVRARSREQLLLVGAHVLRHHIQSSLGTRQIEVAVPESDFMHHLMERSGTLSIRPIETEVYSTWVDMGVSSSRERRARPADLSLIYDLVSGTWHGDF